jgi:hypothetical protein
METIKLVEIKYSSSLCSISFTESEHYSGTIAYYLLSVEKANNDITFRFIDNEISVIKIINHKIIDDLTFYGFITSTQMSFNSQDEYYEDRFKYMINEWINHLDTTQSYITKDELINYRQLVCPSKLLNSSKQETIPKNNYNYKVLIGGLLVSSGIIIGAVVMYKYLQLTKESST